MAGTLAPDPGSNGHPTHRHVQRATRPECVLLVRDRLALDIFPPRDDLLARLTTAEHVLDRDASGGSHVATHVRRLCPVISQRGVLREITGQDRILEEERALIGLEPVLRHWLEAEGCEVQLVDPAAQLPAPDLAAVQSRGVLDRDLLDGAAAHARLLVRYNRHVQPAWLIAELALAFPAATFAIGVARRLEAQQLGDVLRQWLPDVTIATVGREPREPGQVVVGTFMALGALSVRLTHRNVFIALNALEAMCENGKLAMGEAMRARFIGLLAREKQLAPGEEDDLRAVFGFDEVVVPAHGHHFRPVDVVMVDNKAQRLPPSSDVLTLKRRAVWRNPARNRRLARLAKALAAGDTKRLAHQFPRVASAASGSPLRVLVLADNVEQAEILGQQLPGWPIVTAGSTAGAAQAQAIASGGSVVITVAAVERINLNAFDVLVRADAGVGLPPWSDGQLMAPGADERRFLLVDLDDRRDRQLRRWSQQRQRAYRARAWFAPCANLARERIIEFLKCRP